MPWIRNWSPRLVEVPLATLNRHPLGCVERRGDGQAIAMYGLLERDSLNEVDLGFAFPPAAHVLDAVGLHVAAPATLQRNDQAVAAVRHPCQFMLAQHAIRKRRIGPGLPR